MQPCNCCGRITESPTIIGLQRGLKDEPALILWNCPCGTTRAVKWSEATSEQWRIAQDVEDAVRPKSPEMMLAPAR